MMTSNKIDFISDLLARKDVRADDKERFFMLAKEEIKLSGESDANKINDIVKRIEKLEESKSTKEIIDVNISEKVPKAKILNNNPKHVAEFMSLFNKRDGLKYLTHDFDEDGVFEIEAFLEKAKEVFKNKSKRGQLEIPISLWQILNQFAFEKKPNWFSYDSDYKNISIKEGWFTDKWINWSKENNNLHPIRNIEYKIIINHFRQLTRIESPQLETLVENVIDNVFGKNSEGIDTVSLSKADFYTHVPSFRKALISIFEEIKYREEKLKREEKKVSIKFERTVDDNFFIRKLIITHYDSFPSPSKEIELLSKEWQSSDSKGTMGGIKNYLIGYCNWSVETKIEGKAVRINILRDAKTSEIEYISDAVGFTHILTFYYK